MATVRVVTTGEATASELGAIHRLCVDAFAGDGGGFSDDDWDHTLGGWHAVVEEGGAVLAHAAVVARVLLVGDRPVRTGYVEGVATAPGRHGEGLGSLAMTAAGDVVRREFEMGALSTGRHTFYERLGWERWQGPTFARHEGGTVHTEDDDGDVLVLRFGASEDVDLRAALTCEGRAGDDW